MFNVRGCRHLNQDHIFNGIRVTESTIKTVISSPERTIEAAREALEKRGGSLIGDLESGELVAKTPVGDVVGRYAVEGGLLTVQIVRKPRLAPSAVVRSVVASFFANLES